MSNSMLTCKVVRGLPLMHGGEQWHAHTQKKQELEGSDNDLNF